MVERLLVAVGLIVLGAALYLAWTRWQLWRVRRAAPGLDGLQTGTAAILYFTAPGCVPCRTFQVPALETLQADLGDALQVIKIDASERPEVADFWGVISVPTTFVLDRQGRARRVNHGIAGTDKLRDQLEEIGAVTHELASRRASEPKTC